VSIVTIDKQKDCFSSEKASRRTIQLSDRKAKIFWNVICTGRRSHADTAFKNREIVKYCFTHPLKRNYVLEERRSEKYCGEKPLTKVFSQIWRKHFQIPIFATVSLTSINQASHQRQLKWSSGSSRICQIALFMFKINFKCSRHRDICSLVHCNIWKVRRLWLKNSKIMFQVT